MGYGNILQNICNTGDLDASQTTQTIEEPVQQEAKAKKNKKNKEEKPKMDPEFFYDYESLKFKPVVSEESNLGPQILKLL